MTDVGALLKNLRASKNMTQQVLSNLTHISQPVINRLENNGRAHDIDSIQRICDACGITLVEFFAEAEMEIPLDIWKLVSKKENHALLKVLQNMIDKGHPSDAIKEGLEFLDRVKKVYDKPENKGKVAWVDKKPDEPDGYDESTKKEVANRLKEELNKGTKTPWKE